MRALNALAGMLSRGIEDPSTPLDGTVLLSEVDNVETLWGPNATRDPLRVADALRAVQILSSAVAGCPLNVRKRSDLSEVSIPALQSYRVGTTPFELWETVVSHIALWGNAYVRKVRARDGRLVELVPIHPARVDVKLADDDDADAVGMPFVKRFVVDGGRVSLSEFEVMHVPGLSVDGLKGISIVGNLRQTFDQARQLDDIAALIYNKGLRVSGYLEVDGQLTEEQAGILQRRWRAKYTGTDAAGTVAILDSGAKFKEAAMSPADAQFLETRKFSTTQIARLFGLPGWVMNDQEKSTSWGTGMEQQFVALVVITLQPYFHRIEQRVVREICDPKAEKAEFKVEGLLRGDSKARAAFYASGVQHGWLVPNDIRDLEDMPHVSWGDEPYRPFNESASAQKDAEDDTKPGGDDDDDADA